MIEILKGINYHYNLVNLIKEHRYHDQNTTILLENDTKKRFRVKGGIRQGCILFLSNVNLCTESMMKEREKKKEEYAVSIHGRKPKLRCMQMTLSSS